jgi:hypothetical protein
LFELRSVTGLLLLPGKFASLRNIRVLTGNMIGNARYRWDGSVFVGEPSHRYAGDHAALTAGSVLDHEATRNR